MTHLDRSADLQTKTPGFHFVFYQLDVDFPHKPLPWCNLGSHAKASEEDYSRLLATWVVSEQGMFLLLTLRLPI